MKELIYSNFQLTRSTGVPTMVVVDGVSVEMHKNGRTPAPKKAKTKKPRRPEKKASGKKPKKPRAPEAASKPATVRRTEATPQ